MDAYSPSRMPVAMLDAELVVEAALPDALPETTPGQDEVEVKTSRAIVITGMTRWLTLWSKIR